MLLSFWVGVVLAEVVIELVGARPGQLAAAAAFHYWIDLLLEIPLLTAIVASGVILAVRSAPLGSLLWIKIACGLVAIGGNLVCAVLVIARHRRRDDEAAMRRYQWPIRGSIAVAPFALAAAYLGLVYFRH